MSRSRPDTEDTRFSAPSRTLGRRDGAALVLVILLTGVIVALTLQLQSSSAVLLKSSRQRGLRTRLRVAATDSAWTYMRTGAARQPGSTARTDAPAEEIVVLPSGMETVTRVVDGRNEFLSAVPLLNSISLDGSLYLLRTSASVSNATEQVACIYRRDKQGAVEVLGWFQER